MPLTSPALRHRPAPQVCLALHHVHEQGILHRDLKSSNIFCDTFSIVKLGDFGISKMMGAESQCHTIVGTPYYLSPEICEVSSPFFSRLCNKDDALVQVSNAALAHPL